MSFYRGHSPYSAFGFASYITPMVKRLIVFNVALFILVCLLPGVSWLNLFGLVPRELFGKLRLWQLATYMFLHVSLWHLAVNMLMLWFFAPPIESAWGGKEFLRYYFFTGIGAGLCSFVTSFRSAIPVIGASGAIFGILVAYALMYPQTLILLFFFFPMKIKHAVLVLAGINLLGALSQPYAGIAYFAHLGGGLFGYLYLKSEWLKRKLSYRNLSSFRLRLGKRKLNKSQMSSADLQREVDKILDKVSKYGVDSLSTKEKKILQFKSKESRNSKH